MNFSGGRWNGLLLAVNLLAVLVIISFGQGMPKSVSAAVAAARNFVVMVGDTGSLRCSGGRLGITWLDKVRSGVRYTCASIATTPSVSPTMAVATVTQTPSPTGTQGPTGTTPPVSDSSISFPVLDGWLVGGFPKEHANANPAVVGCTAAEHDRYFTVGPDGKKYRSWHPITVWTDEAKNATYMNGASATNYITSPLKAGTVGTCSFGHEHGEPPLAIAKPELSGIAPLPAFGYTNVAEGRASLEPHAGFKVFTHLANNQSGWRVNEVSGGQNPFQPYPADWDMQVEIHQGAPSKTAPSILAEVKGTAEAAAGADLAPSATRISQQFHEFTWWGRNPGGQITDIRLAGDTGLAIGKSVGGIGGAGRIIVDKESPAYEIWNFEGRVGNAWDGMTTSFVLGPMDYFDGTISIVGGLTVVSGGDRFRSSQETICGTGGVFSTCTTVPYGSWKTPAYGFVGTMRGFDSTQWSWTNSTGQEYYCTDARGNIQEMTLCDQGKIGFIKQRVAKINFSTPASSGWTRNSNSPGQWYDRMFPEDRMPVGAPMGN